MGKLWDVLLLDNHHPACDDCFLLWLLSRINDILPDLLWENPLSNCLLDAADFLILEFAIVILLLSFISSASIGACSLLSVLNSTSKLRHLLNHAHHNATQRNALVQNLVVYCICTVPVSHFLSIGCLTSPRPPIYFVLMCFSFPGEYRKLFAYALGTNFLSCGSCTKYSYPCFSANRIASSLDAKLRCVPCM